IYGPPGTTYVVEGLRRIAAELPFPVQMHELKGGERFDLPGALPLLRRRPCVLWVETSLGGGLSLLLSIWATSSSSIVIWACISVTTRCIRFFSSLVVVIITCQAVSSARKASFLACKAAFSARS